MSLTAHLFIGRLLAVCVLVVYSQYVASVLPSTLICLSERVLLPEAGAVIRLPGGSRVREGGGEMPFRLTGGHTGPSLVYWTVYYWFAVSILVLQPHFRQLSFRVPDGAWEPRILQ